MRVTFIICLLFLFSQVRAQLSSTLPTEVEAVLKKAGSNRHELEKLISYAKNTGDPLKLKAAYFLIANMDIQYTFDYYWADKEGKKVPFNELSYADFNTAAQAFNTLKARNPGLHPQSVVHPDIEVIKGELLIQNLDIAFKTWRSSSYKNIPFNDFCEYILPYKVSVEPYQEWRESYSKKFSWINEKAKANSLKGLISYVAADERSWFSDTWGKEDRKEPLPRLSALQLLLRKNGRCEDIADLEVFTLRSQGIPAALNIIPFWATASDSHFLNTVFDEKMTPIPFDVSRTPAINNPISREPSKVLRMTYSKQPQTIASMEEQQNIPDGFMRAFNYIDVTNQYWETTNITCDLKPNGIKHKYAFACVFNGLTWKPTWWGNIENNKATFSTMSKGVVYLPAYYENSKILPAGYPVAAGYHHEMVIRPDTSHKTNLTITNQEKYLNIDDGKPYRLFYWDNNWKFIGQTASKQGTKMLTFANVPKEALYLLLPQNSKHKERPFMIVDNGQIVWF